jgi:hypothetical protein
MSKTLWCIGTSVLGILLPASIGFAAQVIKPEPLAISPILIAQTYSCDGCQTASQRFDYFEAQGDNAYRTGQSLYNGSKNRRDYNRAYGPLSDAVNFYNLCLSVEIRDGVTPARKRQVERKRDAAASLRDRVQQLRASR